MVLDFRNAHAKCREGKPLHKTETELSYRNFHDKKLTYPFNSEKLFTLFINSAFGRKARKPCKTMSENIFTLNYACKYT